MKINIIPTLLSAGIGGAMTFLIISFTDHTSLTSIMTVYISHITLLIMCFGVSLSDSREVSNMRTTAVLFLLATLICNIFFLNYDIRTEVIIATNSLLLLSCIGIAYSISKA